MAAQIETIDEQSSSSAFEMQPFGECGEDTAVSDKQSQPAHVQGTSDPEDIRNDIVPRETAVEAKQKWNSPPSNMWKVFACYFSFLVVGANDGSYGVSSNSSRFLEP